MKKVNLHLLALMLLGFLFTDVVPAAEINNSKKVERLWCLPTWMLCKPPQDPTPLSTPSGSTKSKPAPKTTTEKR